MSLHPMRVELKDANAFVVHADRRGGQHALFDLEPQRGQDLGPKVRWVYLTGNEGAP